MQPTDEQRAARAAREAKLKADAAELVRAWMAAERLSYARAAVRLGYPAKSGAYIRRVRMRQCSTGAAAIIRDAVKEAWQGGRKA